VLDQTLLTREELDSIARPRRSSIAVALATGLLLPFAFVIYVPLCLVGGIFVTVLRMRPRPAASGTGRVLGLEALAALLVIPVIELVTSVGTGLAFYLVTKGDSDTGWRVLSLTIIVSAGFVLAVFVAIVRHRSGVAPLPFEPDVEPERGIETARSWRRRRAGGFLPGQARFAAERANAALRDPDLREPGLWPATVAILSGKHDRWQLVIVLVFGAGWVGVSLARGGRWWVALALCAASIILFLACGAIGALIQYYDVIRLARRESELRLTLERRDAINDQQMDVGQLVADVRFLAREIQALRTRLDDPGGAWAHACAWLDRRRGRRLSRPGRC
jgi:hypothetical protein